MIDKKTEVQMDRIRHDIVQRVDKKFEKITVSATTAKTKFSHAENRKEGETWVDSNGKKWIKQNGIIQSISRMSSLRIPVWCPKCEKTMAHRLDNKFYVLHGFCMDCTLSWHTRMKIDGTWDAYETRMVRANEKAFLLDKIAEHEDYIKNFRTPQSHYGDGRWDELAPRSQFEGVFAELRDDIAVCKNRLAQIEADEQAENEAILQEKEHDNTDPTNTTEG